MDFKKALIVVIILIIIICVCAFFLMDNNSKIKDNVNVTNNTTNVTNDTVKKIFIDLNDTPVNQTNQTNSLNNSSDGGWVWSGQADDYIKEYNDDMGTHHVIFKSTGDHIQYMKNGEVYYNGENITEAFHGDFK